MTFSLSGKTIVSEVIDNEAIIIDMRSGTYFSTEGTGCTIWSAAIAGQGREHLLASVASAYPNASSARADANEFLDLLVEKGLVVETNSGPADPVKIDWPVRVYVRPQLSQHSDMQDLIMLDPIHDVNSMGWPTKREDTPPLPAE